MGKPGFDAAEAYLRRVDTLVDLNGSGMMIEVNAAGGNFCLSIMQEREEDIYVNAFLRELEAENISYTLAGKDSLRVASLEME